MSRVELSAKMLQPYQLGNPHAVFDLRRPDTPFFQAYYFLGRIHFAIDDFDVGLTSPSIAILGFAVDLKTILNRLSAPGESILRSVVNDEDIRFARAEKSDRVLVDPTWREGSVEADYDDLLTAADRFLQDLLDELSHKFPQLTENEAYPRWRSL